MSPNLRNYVAITVKIKLLSNKWNSTFVKSDTHITYTRTHTNTHYIEQT